MGKKSKNKDFLVIMPPPNVTGNLHIGHALTFYVQDFLLRSNLILGRGGFLVPGCDHGGIAGEYTTRKTLGKTEVSLEEIHQVTNQSKKNIIAQFKAMDLWINWDCFEYTMGEDHVKLVQETFIKLYQDGFVKKSHRIVSFDTYFGTAVSDLEVEHKSMMGKIYEITYKLEQGGEIKVATTRPETIFADVALAVNPEDSRYKNLIGKKALIPLINRSIPIIADQEVDRDFGTGVLKITPAHAPIDYEIGKRHKLPMISMISRDGLAVLPGTDYDKMTMKELRSRVTKELSAPSKDLEQSIPHSSRSRTQIEYILEQHWFLDMEKFAKKALKRHPKFLPEHWKKTYDHWLKNINPWCLSRTIKWGQRIPAYFNKKGETYVGFKPPQGFQREDMVFDTWFSSALWPALFKKKYNLSFDLVVTGFDILFFWIARMVMMEDYCSGELPFKEVFIHGLICDEKGEKMSKTRGNVLDPMELIEKHGNKLVRLSLLRAFTTDNKIKFSENTIRQSSPIIQKLKNLKRFLELKEITPWDGSLETEDKFLAAIYNHIQCYLKEYVIQIENRDLQKQVQIARDFLYFVCGWIVELAKVDSRFFAPLAYGFSQVNSMFFPILGGEKVQLLHRVVNYKKNNGEFTEFQRRVTMLRFFKKLDDKVWVDENLLNSFCGLKKSPQATHRVEMGSMVIFLSKRLEDLADKKLPNLREELAKIKNIPLERVNSQKKKEFEERIKILRNQISWLDNY
jgi:valyl-tRNA synthetase